MRIKLFHLLFACFLISKSYAQDDLKSDILTFDSFVKRVQEHHPLSKQAYLQEQFGEAEIRSTRGAFDPKAYADLTQKYFNDKQYYSKLEGGVKIPTWFGIEFLGGYEDNEGDYLNPENSVPGTGLYFAGISVPVGQGLFIDKRRAALKTAKLYAESTKASRQYLLNQLYLKATKAYWYWFQAYHQKKVFQEAVSAAAFRLSAVKQGATLGDRPQIDTLEAQIQLQNRELALQEASLALENSIALLNTFLWDEGLIPLELEETTVAPALENTNTQQTEEQLLLEMDTLLLNHPELVLSRFEIEQLEVDRRLKAEMLKPTLNLKYQPLVEGIGDEIATNYNQANYKWGLEFSFPILLRKERGSLQKAKIKLAEKQFALKDKNQNLKYKATTSFNSWQTSISQVELYQQNSFDYEKLLDGERSLFKTGESSLFLVNRRELGYINAQLKWIEALVKNYLAKADTYYSLGILPR